MKIEIPKSRHDNNITVPVLGAMCHFDKAHYREACINIECGMACRTRDEFRRERDRLLERMRNAIISGKVKIKFISDPNPDNIVIYNSDIVYLDHEKQYNIAGVYTMDINIGTSPNEEHITIGYNNNSFIAANYQGKWYVMWFGEGTDNVVILGTLDMKTTSIEDLVKFIEFETGMPHYRGLLEDK